MVATALLTPIIVSFIPDDDKTFNIIDRIFDIGFGIDIIMNFITAYYDPYMGQVTNMKTIARQYLKKWFWIDLLPL